MKVVKSVRKLKLWHYIC